MEGMDEALGWYGWAWRCVWAPLWWVLAAFRWSALPVTVTDGAGRVDGSIEDDDGELGWAEADVIGVDDADTAGTASAVASSGGLGAAFGQRSGSVRAAFGLWGQLWVDNPPGTFLFDHWIAATLAAIVIAISFRCEAFSQILGRRFLASFSRHLAHISPCIMTQLAALFAVIIESRNSKAHPQAVQGARFCPFYADFRPVLAHCRFSLGLFLQNVL